LSGRRDPGSVAAVNRHILPASFAAVALALGAASLSEAQTSGPTPVAPSNGKTQKRGVPFTFKVRDDEAANGVFFKVSKSKAVGDDGTLANDIYFREMKKSGGLWQKKVERYAALNTHFLNRPGRYYWQAYSIDCSVQDDCNVEGPIKSFTIK
jgi:hypothetical protein